MKPYQSYQEQFDLIIDRNCDWLRVPPHIREAIAMYLVAGVPPGSFCEAVLQNDLKNACAYADDINRHKLFDIVSFLYLYAPQISWGSVDKVREWCASGGMEKSGAKCYG